MLELNKIPEIIVSETEWILDDQYQLSKYLFS